MQQNCIAGKERDYLFDNVKALLVFSVVIAHYYKVGTDFTVSSFGGAVYVASFSFIMQGFLFASGYFAKNAEKAKKTAIKSLLFPYLLLMPVMYGVRYAVFGFATMDLLCPTMALWFLLTLFYYRYFMVYLIKIKWLLPMSVAVSLLAGFVPFLDETLSLGRTFGFLPFFVTGYYCQSEHIRKIRAIPKTVGWLVLAALIAYTALFAAKDPFSLSHLYLKYSYEACGTDNLTGLGIRILLSAVAVLWIFVFINLTSGKKNVLTLIGQNTMAVYVLHIVVRYVIKGSDIAEIGTPAVYLLLAAAAVLSLWLFSRTPVANAYQRFMDGLYDLLAAFGRRLLRIVRQDGSKGKQ